MGAAIDALSDVGTAFRSPKLLAVATVFGVLANVLSLGFNLVVPGGGVVWGFLLAPAFVGGLLGMTKSTLAGDPEVGDFFTAAKNNYLSLVGAFLLTALLYLGVVIIALVGSLFVGLGVGVGTAGLAGGSPEAAGAMGMIGSMIVPMTVLFLVVVVFFTAIQFLDVAIVVGDESALSSFSDSWAVFAGGPGSVLLYTVIRGTVVGLLTVVPLGLAVYGLLQPSGEDLLYAGLALFVLLIPVSAVFGLSYHVAYYARRKVGA